MKKAIYIGIFLVVALLIGGYAASNYAVSYILGSLASSQVDVDKAKVLAKSYNQHQYINSNGRSEELNTPKEGSSPSSVQADHGDGLVPLENIEGSNEKKQGTSTKIEGSSSINQNHESGSSQGMKYSPEVSQEKAKAVEQSVTAKEKAQILSVLIKKLSAEELQLFLKMASNGVSVEEKREAKKIILKKLTEDEYDQLISIASKYGLSQGKSYKESQKE